MTLASRPLLFIAAAIIFLGTFLPVSAACSPACTGTRQCYTFQGQERCMTPAEYAAANREGAGGTGVSEGAGSQTGRTAGGCGGALCNPLKVNSLTGLLNLIVDAAIQLGTIVLVLALIWTGFKFVAARGNPTEIANTRKMLFWVVLGGLLLLGAKGLSEVIKSTATSL